ncbi:MAG TPA: tRNA (guanosine(46)-N7)-methyltransferase TrmB [bacterium]|jgi:tRNA (guanine-N7-)-methyltransferase|nr:tRNA (guanosine(46)-N7)-methyltransferase TrmB [bacterium]HNT66545.1 tRNA (guanosine(46)-N7)-methyltransferase TrmB [bacterium]HOX86203.1 tRNA (guanosine(46)-N7)-methyltransferase TrmB [bacterium]HPG45583.1 tRNA (guanosine(46)-N7)-methyltransferase TrmB [bacterium]HPM97638.1 tRNA (guanosine(46)-N7)-methyltransferase TrmB [bacterium]
MVKKKLIHFAEFESFPNTRTQPTGMKGHWRTHFFHNDHPIVLELACGRGEYTIALAQRCPDKNFIGVDRKGARMWAGARQALEESLANVGFLRITIETIENFFGRHEVDEIWILFPDPYPKQAKAQKRLTSSRFLRAYQRILRPDGVIHLKTDDDGLYSYTKNLLLKQGHAIDLDTADVMREYPNDEILRLSTYYQDRHLKSGKTIKYLRFRLNQQAEFTEAKDAEQIH